MQAFGAMSELVAPKAGPPAAGWAASASAEAQNYHASLAERLLAPHVSAEQVSPLLVAIGHFCDSHWADYRDWPAPDPAKQAEVQRILGELAAVNQGLGQLLLTLTQNTA